MAGFSYVKFLIFYQVIHAYYIFHGLRQIKKRCKLTQSMKYRECLKIETFLIICFQMDSNQNTKNLFVQIKRNFV